MQLNELLEEQSIKSISAKTMISEENIERIVAEDFSSLTEVKALGFISILEREYKLDLKEMRKNAHAYYDIQLETGRSPRRTIPQHEDKNGHSIWFFLMMFGLLAYASWYFFTQYDKKIFSHLIPFSDQFDTNVTEGVLEKNHVLAERAKKSKSLVSVGNEDSVNLKRSLTTVKQNSVVVETKKVENMGMKNKKEVVNTPNTNSHFVKRNPSQTQEVSNYATKNQIIIHPVKRLWFGLINMRTKKRDHFTIKKPFTLDLSKGDWLVATSITPFSFITNTKVQKYDTNKEHYFMITKEGIEELNKTTYMKKGGYRKW